MVGMRVTPRLYVSAAPVLTQEEQGQIKIIGALYDMSSGTVEFLD